MGKRIRKQKPKNRNAMATALHLPIFHGKIRKDKKRLDKMQEKPYSDLSTEKED